MCPGHIAADHGDGDAPGANTDAIMGVNKVVHKQEDQFLPATQTS